MKRTPPSATRTDTLFPYTTLFRFQYPHRLQQIRVEQETAAMGFVEILPGAIDADHHLLVAEAADRGFLGDAARPALDGDAGQAFEHVGVAIGLNLRESLGVDDEIGRASCRERWCQYV